MCIRDRRRTVQLMKQKRQEAEGACAKVSSERKAYEQVEGRYKWALQHLQLKQSGGCFVHDGKRFCIGVKRWCGEGSSTHACSEQEQQQLDNAVTPVHDHDHEADSN
eukprot:TRINITY_DN5620_c0_g1_i3.p3 TRINITY_DN5620_c0_g1~~TRINITY_DN5620_c0_g1_i3.p3  ORF type:complete len:107 (-),score=39.11 TRINITY_DN5620_c0_g1_i3:37-357(-)